MCRKSCLLACSTSAPPSRPSPPTSHVQIRSRALLFPEHNQHMWANYFWHAWQPAAGNILAASVSFPCEDPVGLAIPRRLHASLLIMKLKLLPIQLCTLSYAQGSWACSHLRWKLSGAQPIVTSVCVVGAFAGIALSQAVVCGNVCNWSNSLHCSILQPMTALEWLEGFAKHEIRSHLDTAGW